MSAVIERSKTSTHKWGWGILLVVSALLVLNGLGWFFAGPNSSLSGMAESLGLTTAGFEESYPSAALLVAANARQAAIWFMAFGLLALLVALEGYRHGSRWAWYASWVLVAALLAVGVLEAGGPFGTALLVLTAIALVGQFLARRGLA